MTSRCRRQAPLVAAACACLVIGCGGAQRARGASPATATTSLSARRFVVPLMVVGSTPSIAAFVRVMIHGRPYLFRLDTGAGHTVIDPAVARTLGLRASGRPYRSYPFGCAAITRPIAISDWSLSGIPLPPSSIGSQHGLIVGVVAGGGPVVGLLGSDVLSRLGQVSLDFAQHQLVVGGPVPHGREVVMRVHHPNGKTYETIAVSLDGQPGTLVLDTGASSTLLTASLANRAHLRHVNRPIEARGAVGCRVRVQPIAIDNWSTSGVSLPPLTAFATNATLLGRTIRPLDGILGSDVLSEFDTVTLDFRSGRLILGARD